MIEITNLTKRKIILSSLKKKAKKVLEGEKKENFNLSIALIGGEAMKKLNKKYRSKDKKTDVLSFGGDGKPKDLFRNFGEVIICLEAAEGNAKKFGNSFNKELEQVLVHGILHLLGFNHEEGPEGASRMFRRQERYL